VCGRTNKQVVTVFCDKGMQRQAQLWWEHSSDGSTALTGAQMEATLAAMLMMTSAWAKSKENPSDSRIPVRINPESQVKAIGSYPEGHKEPLKNLDQWRFLVLATFGKVPLASVWAVGSFREIIRYHKATQVPNEIWELQSIVAKKWENWTDGSLWSEFGKSRVF
jgi:hypothetical protein